MENTSATAPRPTTSARQNVERKTEMLRNKIAIGTWAVGDRIDTFRELMDDGDIPTIYRAQQVLRPLILEGLIESRQGAGTFLLRIPNTDPEQNPVQGARDLLAQAARELAVIQTQISNALSLLEDAA